MSTGGANECLLIFATPLFQMRIGSSAARNAVGNIANPWLGVPNNAHLFLPSPGPDTAGLRVLN